MKNAGCKSWLRSCPTSSPSPYTHTSTTTNENECSIRYEECNKKGRMTTTNGAMGGSSVIIVLKIFNIIDYRTYDLLYNTTTRKAIHMLVKITPCFIKPVDLSHSFCFLCKIVIKNGIHLNLSVTIVVIIMKDSTWKTAASNGSLFK